MRKEKKTTSKPGHLVGDALALLANAKARNTKFHHDVQGAGEVARSKLAAGAAGMKREAQKHIDQARVKATSKRHK